MPRVLSESISVLVVEDDPSLIELYERYLDGEYQVLTAKTGEEALKRIDEHIDVVLLDRHLPGQSGDEILAEIRASGYTCPVAMITAVEPDIDIIDLPFDEYLTKPIDQEQLDEVVRRLVHRSAFDRKSRELFQLASKKATLNATGYREHAQITGRIHELRTELDDSITRLINGETPFASRDTLTQDEIDTLLSEVFSHRLPEDLRGLVEDSQALTGTRPPFMWRWVHSLAPKNTLPCVDDAYQDRVPVDKTITILFITLLDDCLEKRRDEVTFSELKRIPDPMQSADPSRPNCDAAYVAFTQRVWETLIERIQEAPNFDQYFQLFRHDIGQAVSGIEYSRIPIDAPELATMTDLERAETHNMAMFAYADIDLMYSPIEARNDLPVLREAIWDAQLMARIGNWISTWERELREGDFSAGPIVYALEHGIVTNAELMHIADVSPERQDRLIGRIREHGVEKEFFIKWERCYYRLFQHNRSLEFIDLEPYIKGMEDVLRYHLASTGLK